MSAYRGISWRAYYGFKPEVRILRPVDQLPCRNCGEHPPECRGEAVMHLRIGPGQPVELCELHGVGAGVVACGDGQKKNRPGGNDTEGGKENTSMNSVADGGLKCQ